RLPQQYVRSCKYVQVVLPSLACICLILLSEYAARAGREYSTSLVQRSSIIDNRTATEGLEPGRMIERILSPSEVHVYAIRLRAGQFVRISVEQLNVDVVLTLVGPDGKPISHVDRPSGSFGSETICHIAETTGPFILQISHLSSAAPVPGRYRAQILALR